ncbi:MAG: nucleotidyltransferase [Bacteroidales bacterium]|nr:nucleotidyltransferase [Bacteroidales bacterium]
MKKEFKTFCENIKLTQSQRDDAKTKFDGVCKKLHNHYYDSEYDGATKYLFGSYKTKTNTRPLSDNQDVDVLFKISKETFDKFDEYESNGQSALLQEVKDILKEKYTTTDKISSWGKVVLIVFTEGNHNVEVLPGYEQEDGTFLIPNTEDGGSWETFDPRTQIDEFRTSNDKTDGLTAELCRMIKTWVKNTSSLKENYKSFKIVENVMAFLESDFEEGESYEEYHNVVKNFLDYLNGICGENIENHVITAYNRTVKAIEYMDNDKPSEASDEWRKIFGSEFPKVKENPKNENHNKNRIIVNPSSPWCR